MELSKKEIIRQLKENKIKFGNIRKDVHNKLAEILNLEEINRKLLEQIKENENLIMKLNEDIDNISPLCRKIDLEIYELEKKLQK